MQRKYLFLLLTIIAVTHPVKLHAEINHIDPLKIPSQPTRHVASSVMLAITRTDNGRLISVGEQGRIYFSDDNGHLWKQAKEVPVSVTLTAVSFPTDKLGWAVGHSGIVLSTADGGNTWKKNMDGGNAAAIEFSEAEQQANENPEDTKAQKRLRSAKYLVKEGADKPFLDVHFVNKDIGYIIGAYGLAYKTTNGGKQWLSLQGLIDNPRGRHLSQLHFSADALFIVGEQGALFRSTDQGKTFNTLNSPYSGTWFGMVSEINNRQLAFGLRGNLFSTNNDGESWKKETTDSSSSITSGLLLNNGALALADESGRLFLNNGPKNAFTLVNINKYPTFTDLVQASDNSLVLTSVRGMVRIEYDLIFKRVDQ